MTLILDLNPAQEREIETLAQSEGVSVGEYAIRRLLPSYAAGHRKKPLVLDRYDKTPDRQKTAAEIDAIVADYGGPICQDSFEGYFKECSFLL